MEARKTYAAKLHDGFIDKYLSGAAILDIGYRGYETDVLPIVPQAIGIDLDYPGYDGRTLPFPDHSQDAVFSSHCLEHADDCRVAIFEWFRVLKTDGFLIIAVPHKYLYERRLMPPSRWSPDHRRFFTPATLLLRIEDALTPNSYRVRHLADNDFGYVYSIPPDQHPGGCYEIELVVQKIARPSWPLEDIPPIIQPDDAGLSVSAVALPSSTAKAGASAVQSHDAVRGRIVYDGLNLSLSQGTGIATYTRMLTRVSRDLGYEVGVIYETPFVPPRDATLKEILFFDQLRITDRSRYKIPRNRFGGIADHLRCHFGIKASSLRLGDTVIVNQFNDLLPQQDTAYAARNVFRIANDKFNGTGAFTKLSFDIKLDIFHCTYPLPLYVKQSCNIVTIHDVVPFRLPYGTLDNKRNIYNLLKSIVKKVDHIVTVSESSKRDIIKFLGIEESRVTNTYQSVVFADEYFDRSNDLIANFLEGLYGLEMRGYLLFFGALEPKKNVGRLIDAYLSTGVDIPLVLVTGPGWQNEGELGRLNEHKSRPKPPNATGPTIRCIDYVSQSNLVNLIRGSRAVVFPSLLEGFGLPVLEAMTLGAPVVTSSNGALAEIAGDAALLVDPYDVDDIGRAITSIANDADLCGELARRSVAQAAKFSIAQYRKRVEALYASLG